MSERVDSYKMSLRQWFKDAIAQSGVKKKVIAEALGLSASAVTKLLKDERGFEAHEIEILENLLGVAAPRFIRTKNLPILGNVVTNGHIRPFAGNAMKLIKVNVPFPLDVSCQGYEVLGNSMYPAYRAGDVVVVSAAGESVEDLVDSDAIVEIPGEGRFLKRVVRSAIEGLWDLESPCAPPMRQRQISWASGIVVLIPAARIKAARGGVEVTG